MICFVWSLCACPSVHLWYRKSWITFEQVNGFGQNFQGLLGWSAVTFGWVVLPPSPPQVGLGLHPVIFLKLEQVHGCWCYRVISYHFGKLLLSQTTMPEWIFDWMAGWRGDRDRVCYGFVRCAFFTIKMYFY